MIVWRRRLPEWDPTTSGRWKTLPAKLDEADKRVFEFVREDPDEPEKLRQLRAHAPTACFTCDHPNAARARKEIVEIIRAIRQREPLPQGDLPVNCCRRESAAKEPSDIECE